MGADLVCSFCAGDPSRHDLEGRPNIANLNGTCCETCCQNLTTLCSGCLCPANLLNQGPARPDVDQRLLQEDSDSSVSPAPPQSFAFDPDRDDMKRSDDPPRGVPALPHRRSQRGNVLLNDDHYGQLNQQDRNNRMRQGVFNPSRTNDSRDRHGSRQPQRRVKFAHQEPMISSTVEVPQVYPLMTAQSQESVMKDLSKAERCLKWITPLESGQQNFVQFMNLVVNTHLADKLWKKFDTAGRGVADTHQLVDFLVLLVVTYRSMAHMSRLRKLKMEGKLEQGQSVKPPPLDRKQIKQDLEHLAVWIMQNHGKRQYDAYRYVLTKDKFKMEMQEYINEYKEYVMDLLGVERNEHFQA